MVYNKAYKFRLLPDCEQEKLLLQTFGCVRFIWNQMLAYSINYYNEHGKFSSTTPAQFKKSHEWLKKVDSLALANVQMNLKKAFQAFFAKRSKHPRFKSKKDCRQSYTTNNQEASNAIRIEHNLIRLPKIGFIKFIQHRQLKQDEKIKTCTISRSAAGNYYVSVVVEGKAKIKQVKPIKENVLGLDFSMTNLYVDSKGEKINYPRYYRNSEATLHKLHRNVSRKKKGSKNRQKARLKLARKYEHITNSRHDFLHKLSYDLANSYDVIVVEDLNMQNLSQALNFGKSVSDNGWGKFLDFLTYKLFDRGKQLIIIDKWFPSSKMCSSCNTIKKELALSERLYKCSTCGHIQDRDINAAINIRTAGMAGIAW